MHAIRAAALAAALAALAAGPPASPEANGPQSSLPTEQRIEPLGLPAGRYVMTLDVAPDGKITLVSFTPAADASKRLEAPRSQPSARRPDSPDRASFSGQCKAQVVTKNRRCKLCAEPPNTGSYCHFHAPKSPQTTQPP